MIRGWKSLPEVPAGIDHLLVLNVLFVGNMPDEFMDKIKEDEGEVWDRVNHILLIYRL